MTLAIGSEVKTNFNGRIYRLVGFWQNDCVFAPTEGDGEQCLIYSPKDVEELLDSGEFEAVK